MKRLDQLQMIFLMVSLFMFMVPGCGGGGTTAGADNVPGVDAEGVSDAVDVSFDGEGRQIDIAGNHVPVATTQEITCQEDEPCNIVLAGTDADNDTLSFVITVQPSHGTLTGIDTDNKVLNPDTGVTYTPEKNFNGVDSFQFYAFDGKQKSPVALISITVQPQEDAPVAQDITDVTTDEDTPVTFNLKGTDVDGDPLTYMLDSGPAHGTVILGAINADGTQVITYTPERDFNGTDQFTYHANDGIEDSNIARVTITVNPVNDPPVAEDQTGDDAVKTDEDKAVRITLVAKDPDKGDAVTLSIVDQPKHGTLSEIDPDVLNEVTYTPDKDFNGTDRFTFKATDSAGADSNVATVEIVVKPVNDAPIAHDQLDIETNQDTPVEIALSVIDVDGDPLTFKLKDIAANGPLHGTVVFAKDGSANATYTPKPYFPRSHVDGLDGFAYEACDPSGECADAQVRITVHPKNDAPLIQGQTVQTKEDTPVDITLGASDPDNDPITYTIPADKGPSHGKVVLDNDIAHYTPDPNWPADKAAGPQPDTFTVQVCDPANACSEAVITVDVTPVEDPPTARDQPDVTVDQGQSVDIPLDAGDADNDALTFDTVSGPGHGTVTFDNATGTATYTPDRDFPNAHQDSTDTFTYKVCDPDKKCATASVTITVKTVNLPPVLKDQTIETNEDTPVDIPLDAQDPNNDTVTYSMVTGSGPTHGTAEFDNNKIVYTPEKNWPVDKSMAYGEDKFTLKACDGYVPTGGTGEGACSQAVITIHVKPVNDAPVVVSFGTTTSVNKPIVIQIQASDADNDTLSFKFTAISLHGTLYKVDGQGNILTDQKIAVGDTIDSYKFGFVPDNNYTTPTGQPDTLKIKGYDGEAYSNEAVITIAIKGGTNAPPTVENQVAKTQEGTPIDIKLLGTDADNDPLHYWVTTLPDADKGTLKNLAANGLVNGDTVTFVPAAHFNGQATFMFQADDGIDRSSFAVITVTVVPVNDLPTALAISTTVEEDSAATDAANKLVFQATDPDDDVSTLTYKVVSLPAHGTLYRSSGGSVLAAGDIVTDGIVLFMPDPNWPTGHGNANQVFQYAACDNHDPDQPCGGPADVTITVTAKEDPPVAADQTGITTNEDTATDPIILSVHDPDCDELTFKITDASPRIESGMAKVEFSQNGTDANGCPVYQVVYTPVPNWPVGHEDKDAYFTYQADDGYGGTATARITITVHAINDPPDAKDVTVPDPIDEDSIQPLTVQLADSVSDPDGDVVTYSVDATSQNGGTVSVDPNTGELTYSPPANWPCDRSAGPQVDQVTYHVDDGFGGTSTAHVYITVKPVEDIPQAGALSVQVLQESNNNLVTLLGSDKDCNETLVYYIVDQPQHGSLANVNPVTGQVNGNSLLYTPDAGYKGTDFFTYKVNDGAKDSTKATVTITVKAVNHKPTVQSTSVSTPEDNAVTITLQGSDFDSDPLVFRIKDQPQHGTLGSITQVDGSTAQVVYTPVANYNGGDWFTFVANDGIVDSDLSTVTITVNSVNDPPVAQAITAKTNEDTAVDIQLKATDVDDNASTLTYAINTNPAHGSVVLNGNVATYTPARNWPTGHTDQTDSFTYKVTDPHNAADTATVTITVHPVNDVPVANDQAVETNEDKSVTFTLTVSDADGDSLAYSIQTNAQHGSVTFDQAGHATYTPSANWPAGHVDQADTFTYKVDDGYGGTATATVTITVHPINDAPVAKDQSTETNEDTAVSIVLDVSDADGDSLAYSIQTAAQHGTVTFDQAGKATYTPNANWPAGHADQADTFTYKVDDGHGGTATATVTITVHAQEDAPVANDQGEATNEDTPITFTLTASDADNDSLAYTRLAGPSHGTVTFDQAGHATYTPNANWPTGHANQADSFTYQVNDGYGGTDTATVTITVRAQEDAPVANDQSEATNEDTAVTFTLTASDADGDSLAYSIQTAAQHGSITFDQAGKATYTPSANWPTGHTDQADSFTYKVDDGYSGTATATVTITVHAVNDPPVAADKSAGVNEDSSVQVQLTATDADGDAITFTIAQNPANGSVTLDSNGKATYTPNRDWPTGHTDQTDPFTYKADDGHGGTATATVTITVHPLNDQPVVYNIHTYTPANTEIVITLNGTDADGDNLTYSLVDTPLYGSYKISGNQLTYKPGTDFYGLEKFTYTANDGQGKSNSVSVAKDITIAVGIRFVNNAATGGAGTGYTWEDAFLHVQDGINAAQTYTGGNDQVWVAKGTFTAGDTNPLVSLKSGIDAYGAFNGTEQTLGDRPVLNAATYDNQFSTLDGNNTADPVVEVFADNTTMDGFIIENGNASGSGGGISFAGTGARFVNCRIRNNRSGDNGGGANIERGDCTFDHVVFDNNKTTNNGGAIYASNSKCTVTLTNVGITNNFASKNNGGGVYLDSVKGSTWNLVTFKENQASQGDGGAIYITRLSSKLTARNVRFLSNQAGNGGAVYATGLGANLYILNAVFWGNEATDGNGGALAHVSANYTFILSNASFAQNTASGKGGAIYCDDSSVTTEVTNSNLAHDSCNGSYFSLCGNEIKGAGCVRAAYSVIKQPNNGYYRLGTNVARNTDPDYTDYSNGKLTLLYCNGDTEANDDAIDRGNDAAAPLTDILGNPRCDYPGVDNGGTGAKPPDSGAFECPCL